MASSSFARSFLRPLQVAPLRRINQLPSSAVSKRFSGHGLPSHGLNQHSGWLFGEKPRNPGQPRDKELWQYYLAAPMMGYVLYVCTLMWYGGSRTQEWAKVEARRRMEERGDWPTFTPTLNPNANFHPLPPDAECFKPAR